jgi:glycyl-tRNA synthetase
VKEGKIITEWGAYFMALSIEFAEALGIPREKQRFEEKMPAERSHYSSQTFDHQIWLDRWGWVEVAGHAYRTDFDLSGHIKLSGADLSIFKPYEKPITKVSKVVVPQQSVLGPLLREKTRTTVDALKAVNPQEIEDSFAKSGFFIIQGFKLLPSHVRIEEKTGKEAGRRIVPHVVEPSFGAERLVYSALEYAYTRSQDRVVLRLPLDLVPTQLMVFPLMVKDGLPEIASEVRRGLMAVGLEVDYDEAGTIGRRYARADEIGVPLSVTVDYKTKQDQTVTIRDRDSWRQVRSDWRSIPEGASRYLRGELGFSELGTPVEVSYE